MKIVQCLTVNHQKRFGVLNPFQKTIQLFEENPFETFPEFRLSAEMVSQESVQLLAPCSPSKIIGIGLNYRDHIQEMKKEAPAEPLIFLKAPSALNGPECPILLPPESMQVEYEGELAFVIGKTAKGVSVAEASSYILGYSCFNDVTARDLQKKDVQFARAKSFDSFACFGPFIETALDPTNLKLQTRVDGQIRQNSSTENLIFNVPFLLSYLSQMMTLYPGDIVATGTPSGVAPLKVGQTVEIEIDGVGVLKNFVLGENESRS